MQLRDARLVDADLGANLVFRARHDKSSAMERLASPGQAMYQLSVGASALALATWLREQPEIEKVFYAGLEDHPGHALAARQMSGFGGVLSFQIKGGRKEAWKVVDSVQLLSHTANLGDAKTTIVHPATTTHGRLTDEERAAAGIQQGLIRISVGLEHLDDIKADLRQALDQT